MAIINALLPIVLLQPGGASAPLQRLQNYLQKPAAYSVDLAVTLDGFAPKGKGSILRAKNRLLFKMDWGTSKYTYAVGPWGGIELEKSVKQYAETPPMPALYLPESILSGTAAKGLPTLLLAPDVSMAFPERGKTLKLAGKVAVAGVTTDHLQYTASTPVGTYKGDLYIAADGRLMRYILDIRSATQTSRTDYVFSNWKQIASVTDATFKPQIPSGFTPIAFEREPYPVRIGDPLPAISFKSATSATKGFGDLKGQKGLLIVAVRSGCTPTKNMLAATKAELAALPAKGVNVAYLSFDGKPVTGLSAFTTPEAQIRDSLGIPGTPYMILVDDKNIVKWLYFGFDPKSPQELKQTLQTLAPLNPKN